MNVITTQADLEKFCQKAHKSPFLCVDTEFMRESTFYSILCLIQIATDKDDAIIDPLSDDIDLTPLIKLLLPLFDTQIAAMALGFGDSVGYNALVKGRLGLNLDKGARFTDWSRRPLSNKQLHYALGDVTHLRDLYPGLLKELKEKNRLSWVEEEMKPPLGVKKRPKPAIFRAGVS